MTTTSETIAFLWVGDIGIAVDAIESFSPMDPVNPLRPPSIRTTLRSGREHFALFDNKESRRSAIREIRKVLRQ